MYAEPQTKINIVEAVGGDGGNGSGDGGSGGGW
jgi:hypothetical protein